MSVFKYKNSLERAYAPGIADSGEDGLIGDKGVAGPCIYYIGYDLDNSYSINLALQKIENNYLLSEETIEKLPGDKVYKNQDLILSISGQLYMLETADESSAYFFNIKSIGQIFNLYNLSNTNPISEVKLFLILDGTSILGTTYYNKQSTCIPPTSYNSTDYDVSEYELDGVWILPVIYSSEDIDYDMKLYFNFKKELTYHKLPGETEDSSRIKTIQFTKCLEISDIKSSISSDSIDSINTVYFNPIYVSNMTLDRLETTNKIEYTGVFQKTDSDNNNINLSFYKQGISLNGDITPSSSEYQLTTLQENDSELYVLSETDDVSGLKYYTKLPIENDTIDTSYGTASTNPAIPAPSASLQTSLLNDCNNELIKGVSLFDDNIMHAGTSEMWSRISSQSSVYELFNNFSGQIIAEISFTQNTRLYTYTIDNIQLETIHSNTTEDTDTFISDFSDNIISVTDDNPYEPKKKLF